MTYDRKTAGKGPLTPGWDGNVIDLANGDYEVADSVKGIVVTVAGDVACKPVNGKAVISLEGLPAGYILPWHCSHICQRGTTASLATIAS